MTHDSLNELMTRLRREYQAEFPARLADLRRTASEWLDGRDPEPPLATLFHRLSGSAGAYGYSEVSALCRGAEQFLGTLPGRNAETAARLEAAITGVAGAFSKGPTGPDITA